MSKLLKKFCKEKELMLIEHRLKRSSFDIYFDKGLLKGLFICVKEADGWSLRHFMFEKEDQTFSSVRILVKHLNMLIEDISITPTFLFKDGFEDVIEHFKKFAKKTGEYDSYIAKLYYDFSEEETFYKIFNLPDIQKIVDVCWKEGRKEDANKEIVEWIKNQKV